jgi:hypothetical protein
MTKRTEWELFQRDVQAMLPLEPGRHLHVLRCPNDHCLILNAATVALDPKDIGGSLYCVRCDWDWPAPVRQ